MSQSTFIFPLQPLFRDPSVFLLLVHLNLNKITLQVSPLPSGRGAALRYIILLRTRRFYELEEKR